MEAKDTVMTNLAEAIQKHTDLPMGQAIAIEQAEISFKAGIREAVERINSNNQEPWIFSKADGSESRPASLKLEWAKWEAQLKEWGIK